MEQVGLIQWAAQAGVQDAAQLGAESGSNVSQVEAENLGAAFWIHLYAVTVALFVIVPRLVLGLLANIIARRRTNGFVLDVRDPYIARLVASFAGGGGKLQVMPYSYTPGAESVAGLQQIALRLVGEDAQVELRPSVAYGAEAGGGMIMAAGDGQPPPSVALMSLAATPEAESHGAFLTHMRGSLQTPLAVIVDESIYKARLQPQPDGAARLDERRALWRSFCSSHGVQAVIVDLREPDLAAAQRGLEQALAAPVPAA